MPPPKSAGLYTRRRLSRAFTVSSAATDELLIGPFHGSLWLEQIELMTQDPFGNILKFLVWFAPALGALPFSDKNREDVFTKQIYTGSFIDYDPGIGAGRIPVRRFSPFLETDIFYSMNTNSVGARNVNLIFDVYHGSGRIEYGVKNGRVASRIVGD